MITIYWSKYNFFTNEFNPTMDFSPSSVILDQSKIIGKPARDDVNWLGCPSVKNLFKNTFSFKNPMSLNLSFNEMFIFFYIIICTRILYINIF